MGSPFKRNGLPDPPVRFHVNWRGTQIYPSRSNVGKYDPGLSHSLSSVSDFKLYEKTMSVVSKKFGLVLANPLTK